MAFCFQTGGHYKSSLVDLGKIISFYFDKGKRITSILLNIKYDNAAICFRMKEIHSK